MAVTVPAYSYEMREYDLVDPVARQALDLARIAYALPEGNPFDLGAPLRTRVYWPIDGRVTWAKLPSVRRQGHYRAMLRAAGGLALEMFVTRHFVNLLAPAATRALLASVSGRGTGGQHG